VARLLGTNALAFPGNYGRLFLAATVCFIAVAVFIAAMRESAASLLTQPDPSMSPRQFRQPMFDPRFRRFLVFRILLSATAAIDPFLFLYAVTRLGAPITSIGTFAIAAVLGWALSAPVWVWLEQHSSPRAVLQSAGVLRLIAPAIALVLPQLSGINQLRERAPDSSMLVTLFSVAFFAIGAALAAQSRGNGSYLAQSAPHHQLPAYSGLTNAVLVVVAFAPVVGGVLIQRSGYEALFGAAIAAGLVAVFASGWLTDTPMSLPGRSTLPLGGSDRSRSWLSART
jgi:MFS family permease